MLKYKNYPIQWNAQIYHKSQSNTPNLEVARRGKMSWSECTCLSWKHSREHITACVERKTYEQYETQI